MARTNHSKGVKLNYKEAIIAALDGKRVGYLKDGFLTEIRFNKEVLEWAQFTTKNNIVQDWKVIGKNTWGERPDLLPWRIILPLVSFIDAHAASLNGKIIGRGCNRYRMFNGFLKHIDTDLNMFVPDSITALEWTIE